MNRKYTAWKKSRKFGDIYGGRVRPRLTDRIFRRLHTLAPPSPHAELPIYLVDNPSRDFFFPLAPAEIACELQKLPAADWQSITHIWLRRCKGLEYRSGEIPFANFICGSGVRAIVLYPWPIDLRLFISTQPPQERQLKPYARYTTNLVATDRGWFLEWTLPQVRDFYVEVLLYHEIGHNVDWYRRRWSKTNRRQSEEFADRYAFELTSQRSLTDTDL